METNLSARQQSLGMSECEYLCSRLSWQIKDLAFHGGIFCVDSEPMRVSMGDALDMLIRSDAMNAGIEPGALSGCLARLRNEAILKLAEDVASWSFEGSTAEERQFSAMFYGRSQEIRPGLARLLGCSTSATARLLRYHSQNDIESVSAVDYEAGRYSDRTPRVTFDAHDLVRRVQARCTAPFFTATGAGLTSH